MADAFIYFFFIGAGTSLGVAVVTFLSWKVYKRSQNKPKKATARKGIA